MVSGAVCGSPCGGKGTWYKYTYYERSATITYTCPSGYTKNGSKCTKTTTIDGTPSTSYSCPNGGTRDGSKCTLTASPSKTTVYTCPSGYTKTGEGENTKCSKTVQGEGNYYCEDASAVLTGNKCVKTVEGGISHYTCPTGYTLSGTKCSKTTTVTIDADKETKTSTSYKYKWSKYSKLEGWEFTGKTKVVEESYKAGQK